MKQKTMINISYLIALGYVMLSLFFFDWSYRMVPYSKNASRIEMAMDLIPYVFLFTLGIALFIATSLITREIKFASLYYKLVFWGGITFLGIGSVLLVLLLVAKKITPIYLSEILIYWIFYVPTIVLYLNRGKLCCAKK